ncbi:MAG: nucleotidyltransferase domain-containing protein [Desulfobacterales bacterium]
MKKKTTSLDEVIGVLVKLKPEIKSTYGVTAIGVFGSIVRGVQAPDSDVDVVVKMTKPDLFMIVGIKNKLEEKLNRPVDIVTYRENMNKFLKKRIDGEAVYA